MSDKIYSTFTDWQTKNENTGENTKNLLENSFELRRNSSNLRLETGVKTKWDTYHNEQRLSSRISNIEESQLELKDCLFNLKCETIKLEECKEELENVLQSLNIPISINNECLSYRDQRFYVENTIDKVGSELREEKRLLELKKGELKNLCMETWNMKEKLLSVFERINVATIEQNTALSIDKEVNSLTKLSPGISLKPEPTLLATRSSVPLAWEENNKNLLKLHKELCEESIKLRDIILNVISESKNLILSKDECVNTEYRNRIFTIHRSLNDLNWQKSQTLMEMNRVRKELVNLEESLNSLENPGKLCETRHDIRTTRPAGIERCQDDTQFSLAHESVAIKKSQKDITLAILETRKNHEILRSHLANIETDIQDKINAINLEKRCESLRINSSADVVTCTNSTNI